MGIDFSWMDLEPPGQSKPHAELSDSSIGDARLKVSNALCEAQREELSSVNDDYVRWLRVVILRTLLFTNAKGHLHGEFGNNMNSLSIFLGMPNLEEYCSNHSTNQVHKRLRTILLNWERKLSKTCHFPPALEHNLDALALQVGLEKNETELLGLAVLFHVEPIAERLTNILGELRGHRIGRVLAAMLKLPCDQVDNLLRSSAALYTTGLLQVQSHNEGGLRWLIDLLTKSFPYEMMKPQQDLRVLLQDYIHPMTPTYLSAEDYAHAFEDVRLCTSLLKGALERKSTGVNILVWGVPGAGKTEIAKMIAAQLHVQLLEVSPQDVQGDPISPAQRIRNYSVAQKFYADKPCLILFDECEEVMAFRSTFSPVVEGEKVPRKSWINKTLETNAIPTIWISNSVDAFDSAYLRRFIICVELKVPPLAQRKKMVEQALGNKISPEAQVRIAKHSEITPGLFAKAAEVLEIMADFSTPMDQEERDEQVIHLLSSTLKAQGKQSIEAHPDKKSPQKHFELDWLNADVDLHQMCESLRKTRSGRIVLSGIPGTGKTALGAWLAKELDMPHLSYKVSDLLSPYLGETEQKIAAAFAMAREQNALLQIDEVDSFLQERKSAVRHWETTQVNQMLTELDNYDGLFIASTNFRQNLDKASLRRFDLLIELFGLKPEKARQMFIKTCDDLGLSGADNVPAIRFAGLGQLTPGDFEQLSRRSRLIALQSAEKVLEALRDSMNQKSPQDTRPMGFLAVA